MEKNSETDSSSRPVHKRIKIAPSNSHEVVCRQTSTRRVVNLKRRAKLSMLPTLPLDILFEVCSSTFFTGTCSQRLFSDIRTSSSIRFAASDTDDEGISACPCVFFCISPQLILMTVCTVTHRSSMTVWKSSLANVPGLPLCPEDMSHPAWTSLVFDHFCHVRVPQVSLCTPLNK